MKTLKLTLFFLFLITVTGDLIGQNITTPKRSQYARISQEVGISTVSIAYHSPGVKGRMIWGGQVPFGQVWRAGANENTTITFSHDAKVEGQEVKRGTYGLYILPENRETFKILLSKYSQSWGTVAPADEDLVVSATVKTKEIKREEWLSYNFTDRTDSKITIALRWDQLEIPFEVEFNTVEEVVKNMRAELKGVAGFGWRGHMQAAQFCLQNKTNLEEALSWIEKSIQSSKGFSNLAVKAGILAEKVDMQGALKVMDEAVPLGNPNQLNAYGYQLLGMGRTNEAIEIFKYNIEKHPDDPFIWGFTDSLGEAYLKAGDKKMALKYYTIAREKAPENQKANLDDIISGIQE